MSRIILLLYVTVLFLLSLPSKGSKLVIAITHALIFALLLCLTYKTVYRLSNEGFTPITDSANIVQPCQNGTSGANGTCLTCYTGYRLNENSLCVPIVL